MYVSDQKHRPVRRIIQKFRRSCESFLQPKNRHPKTDSSFVVVVVAIVVNCTEILYFFFLNYLMTLIYKL